MMTIYKTKENNKLETITEIVPNSWVNLVNPTEKEILEVVEKTGIEHDLILKILDEEEMPRIETSGNATMIVMDAPIEEEKNTYSTIPLGIFVTNNFYIVTISLKEVSALDSFINNRVKNFNTEFKTRFTIQISLKISMMFLKHLNVINKYIEKKEENLAQSTGNNELLSLLRVEKSLVYFLTALKANDVLLDKIAKGSIITLYEEDMDILDDAIIENKQGIEMANIYREILSSMSDTYATIISNNLNRVMKLLAGITIVFSIPTMVYSFLGMNVNFGSFTSNIYSSIAIGILSLVISLIVAYILRKKDML